MRSGFFVLIFFIMIFLGTTSGYLYAQDAGDAYTATTTADPKLSSKDLGLMLKPLFKEELEVEAQAWLGLFKAKVAEQSILELQAEKAAGDERAKLLTQSATLGEEVSALSALAGTALKALAAKGGDVADYEKYISEAKGMSTGFDVQKIWILIKTWLISAEGGLALALNLLWFVITLVAFYILAGILGGITRKAVSGIKKTSELLKDFFVNSVRKVTVFIGVIIAVSFLGVDIGPFLAAIGVAGFVIGFALQDTLSNFAAGIMILLYRPYDIGDVVTVSGVTGKVDAMSLVSSTVLTPDNQKVVVPNGAIWGGIITNITGNDQRRVDMVFGIGYSDDMAKAQTILEDILAKHEKILKDPAPVIKVHELADSSVNYVVRPWSKTSDYWDVYWDVTRTVKERFDAEGVSIPFPQRDVHLINEAPQA